MKKQLLILITLFFTSCTIVKAQEPQFKFHLAFEDATGAKDTVWLIFDTLATSGNDTIFGEIPISILPDTFQVFVKINASDTGKVVAIPTNYELYGFQVMAKNYVYPIKLQWDTSLIHTNNLPFTINTAYLDNEWFFFNNDGSLNNQYNILTADSSYISLPSFNWGSQEQFPINFGFGYDYMLSTNILDNSNNTSYFKLYPNPSRTRINLTLDYNHDSIFEYYIMDLRGSILKSSIITSDNTEIDLSEISKGIYVISVINEKISFRELIIKL